jgi:hypothetical protein
MQEILTMMTIDFIRRKSREADFPLQVAGAGLLTALGGPLVVVPALGIVAVDALCSVIKGAPGALHEAVTGPIRVMEGVRRSAEMAADRRRELLAAECEEQRRTAEAEQQGRDARINLIDARSEVIRFYESHRRFIQEALPPSLFRAQLRIRFPESLSHTEAWETARDMITELLPIVAASREHAEREEAAMRVRSAEVRTKRRELRRLESELEQLLSGDTEPELREAEARSLREEIRELRNELETLEDESWGNVS